MGYTENKRMYCKYDKRNCKGIIEIAIFCTFTFAVDH